MGSTAHPADEDDYHDHDFCAAIGLSPDTNHDDNNNIAVGEHDEHHDHDDHDDHPAHKEPTPPATPRLQRVLINNPRYFITEGMNTTGAYFEKRPSLLWAVCLLIPLAYFFIMFGLIPIGERKDEDDATSRFHHYFVFSCIVNPINMVIISFLNATFFLSCMGVSRPFRAHWTIMLATFVAQIAVWNLVVPFTGTFVFFGIASLGLCYVTTYVVIYIYEVHKVDHYATPATTPHTYHDQPDPTSSSASDSQHDSPAQTPGSSLNSSGGGGGGSDSPPPEPSSSREVASDVSTNYGSISGGSSISRGRTPIMRTSSQLSVDMSVVGVSMLVKECEIINLRVHYLRYLKVAITFMVFIIVLLLYIFAYQHVSSLFGQKLLPFGMTVCVFIFRKTMLSLTDPFPIDVAMLISGFWVENIYDMFQVMAYRSVKTPVNYVTIWFTNSASLLANLFFLLDFWFIIRLWIKGFLSQAFHGNFSTKVPIIVDHTDDENERGHGNNKLGYHRRQIRFLAYKTFSKAFAAVAYLLIAPMLREGYNKKIFPFATDTKREYRNSLIFSAANFAFLILSGFLATLFVALQKPHLFQHFRKMFPIFIKDRHTMGCVVGLTVHNGIIAISLMMYFNLVWYVFDDELND